VDHVTSIHPGIGRRMPAGVPRAAPALRVVGRVWHDRWVPSASRPPADEPDAAALATIRGQVARMREGLDGIESALQSFERQQRNTERERPARFYDVLVGVYEHGFFGIDDAALAELAGEHGYQRRGLNGFFTGARAALRRSEGRVVLTAEGHRLLDGYLRRLHG